MKKIIALLLVLVMVFSLAACGNTAGTTPANKPQGGGQKYTLTIWGAEQDQDMLKAMCAAYAAANPQNTYKFLFGVQGENDAADKILNDVTSGPDIYSFPSDQINRLFAGGALARILGDHDAAHIEAQGAEYINKAQHIFIVGDAQVAPKLIFLNIAGVDGDDDLHLVTHGLQHFDLAVGLESRQDTGGVMVVKELAAKLQIQLTAEAGAALTNMLGLQLQILFIIKTNLQLKHTPILKSQSPLYSIAAR